MIPTSLLGTFVLGQIPPLRKFAVFLTICLLSTVAWADITVHRNLTFARYGQRELKMDVYCPESPPQTAAIVLVHGGGWVKGSREQYDAMAEELASRGFVVANIDYRLATEAQFPAAVSDVKAATRWLRQRAKQYGFRPDRIAGVGGSAGGHLIAMAALTPGKFEIEEAGNDASSELQAIVVMGSGMDQVARVQAAPGQEIENCTLFFGGTLREVPQIYSIASPINHLSPKTPPILFLDGSQDRPGQRYVEMREKMDALGLQHQLTVIEGAKHGQWVKAPFRKPYVNAIVEFLDRTLSAQAALSPAEPTGASQPPRASLPK